MIESYYEPQRVKIVCSQNVKLPEFSFGLEQAFSWFFGRGVTYFETHLYKENKNIVCSIDAQMPSKELKFSQMTSLVVLVANNYWPLDIKPEELFKLAGEGHEIGQVSYIQSNEERTVMRWTDLDSNVSCGQIAYGLSDLFTGFFWLGASKIKHQLSIKTIQTDLDKGFDKEELEKYLLDKGPDYSLNQTVNTLPAVSNARTTN